MDKNKEAEIYKKAIATWGTEAQLNMVIEECAELIDAVQKWRRQRIDSVKVVEEAVDVGIVLEQLKLILDTEASFGEIKNDKLERLQKRLNEWENRSE